jgi:alpha-L-arabinofuranosidase
MSTVPNVKAIAINALYTDNYDYHGMIQSVDDFETYLLGQYAADPNYSTDTATNPLTQYQFYTSAPGLALEVANQAINNSTHLWTTTVTGGPTVPILGYSGTPIPAIYAQGYKGNNDLHYLLITNKAAQALKVEVLLNGAQVTATLNVTSVSNSSPTAANTALSPDNVQIQTTTGTSPLLIGPNSVTSVSW